jgi:hypothetical protein
LVPETLPLCLMYSLMRFFNEKVCNLVLMGDISDGRVEAVEEHPVHLVAAGVGGVEEGREGRREPVQGLSVELGHSGRDVGGGLDALGEAVDARERERHEVEERGRRGGDRAEPGEDARRGDEGHALAARGQALGELVAGEQVPEGEPREDGDVQLLLLLAGGLVGGAGHRHSVGLRLARCFLFLLEGGANQRR